MDGRSGSTSAGSLSASWRWVCEWVGVGVDQCRVTRYKLEVSGWEVGVDQCRVTGCKLS